MIIFICFSMRGVNTHPGQIALLVIPFLAYSRAMAFEKPTNPCFAAIYADLLAEATIPWTEEMLMILPQPFFSMDGREYFVK